MPETRRLKTKLRRILPRPFVAFVCALRRRNVLLGRYRTWAEARAASKGYDDGAVFEKVLFATRAVVEGRAMWDRDGAIFNSDEINEPLLAALRGIAAQEGGELNLVDFGGALGSTWRQHRIALNDIAKIRWRVVEQPHYVEAGKEFENTTLSFHPSLQVALECGTVSTVLLSSVLPYIESPEELLRAIVQSGVRHVIIDRTSFATDGCQRITVQHVPKNLGGGSYPCWLFNRETLLAPLTKEYRIASEWPGFDNIDRAAIYRGFWLEKNT